MYELLSFVKREYSLQSFAFIPLSSLYVSQIKHFVVKKFSVIQQKGELYESRFSHVASKRANAQSQSHFACAHRSWLSGLFRNCLARRTTVCTIFFFREAITSRKDGSSCMLVNVDADRDEIIYRHKK